MNVLIALGANVNTKNRAGFTPFHYALESKNRNLRSLETLFQHGANINSKDNLGYTALHIACRSASSDIINFLIDNGADINAPTKKYSECGVNCWAGYTPLMMATVRNNVEAVNALLENGAQRYLRDQNDPAALDIAQEREYLDRVEENKRQEIINLLKYSL